MLWASVGRHSLLSEGFQAVLVRSTLTYFNMKYAVFFLLCCLALASAAPQLLGWPGLVAPGLAPGLVSPWGRTLVAGPTVVNGLGLGGARLVAPGYVGPTFF